MNVKQVTKEPIVVEPKIADVPIVVEPEIAEVPIVVEPEIVVENDPIVEVPIIVKDAPVISIIEEKPIKSTNVAVQVVEPNPKKKIADFGKGLRKRIRDDKDLSPFLTSNEKAEINLGIHEFLDWMESAPNATPEEIELKREELMEATNEVIKKATKKKLLDEGKRLRKRCEDDDDLASFLSVEEKKKIRLATQEFLDWMEDCENLSDEEIEKKKQEFLEHTEGIIKKAESKKKLNDFGRKLKKRIQNDEDDLSVLKVEEKERLNMEIDQFLDWIQEGKEEKNLEVKEQEFLEMLEPIEQKAKSKKQLKDLGRNLKKRTEDDDDLAQFLSIEERKKIRLATQEFLDWMEDCENAKELETKRQEILAESEVIIEKAKTKKKLMDNGKRLKKRTESGDDDLSPFLTEEEKKRIRMGTQEFLDWMADCANKTEEEIEAKKKEFHENVEVIIQKAETKKKLNDFGRKLKKRTQKDEENADDDLTPFLTLREKKRIDFLAQEFLDWMAENPNATEDEMKKKKNEMLKESQEIIKNATKKKLLDAGRKMKKRSEEDDELSPFLTEEEKKRIRMGTQEFLDWMADSDSKSEEEIEKKRKEIFDEIEVIIKKAESKKKLNDYGRKIKKRIQEDENDLSEIEIKNKKLIKMEVTDTLDWLEDYPDVGLDEIIEKDEEFRMKMNHFSINIEDDDDEEVVDEFQDSLHLIVENKRKNDNIFSKNRNAPKSNVRVDASDNGLKPTGRRNMRASVMMGQFKSNVQQKKVFYEEISQRLKEEHFEHEKSLVKKQSLIKIQKYQKVTTSNYFK
jgi:hypothetical protein